MSRFAVRKVSFISQLKVFAPILLVFVGGFFVYFYRSEFGSENGSIIWVVFAIMLALFIPQLAIHLRYLRLNKDAVLKYSNEDGVIEYHQGNSIVAWNACDIDSIQAVMTKSLKSESIQVVPWDGYAFMKIRSKRGEVLIVTSILLFDLNWGVKVENYSVETSFYPWPESGDVSLHESLLRKAQDRVGS